MFQKTRFLDLDCVKLENDSISLLITQSVGPRIISLRLGQNRNLLAEVPDFTLECPGEGQFHIWGGHRLWYAPEVPEVTYLPDDRAVEIREVERGLKAIQPQEEKTGIQKSLEIRLPSEDPVVVVDHTLSNRGETARACAPWAITQMRPGGVAILPQNTEFSDPNGLQPNRSIALWPYTDAASPNLIWGNRYSLVKSSLESGPLKIGFPNHPGWLAYYHAGLLFVKKARYQVEGSYYDLGSSSQCYCNDRFLELETLGPKSRLEPGQSTSHREVWEIYSTGGIDLDSEEVETIIDELALSGDSPHLL